MALPEAPNSRSEQYLAKIAGQSTVIPEAPNSRVEQYLDYIAENGTVSKEEIAEQVSDWLEENIHEDPTVVIDKSLSVEGAAADAKAVGNINSTLQEVQPTLKILTLGDSIARGVRNNGKGFVGDLGMPYVNIGVSGASISTCQANHKNVFTQLIDHNVNNPSYYPDVIVAEGGIFDYLGAAPMGEIPREPVSTDEMAEALDKASIMGASGYLFYQMVKLYPKAQRFFLLIHKVKRGENDVYYPTNTRTGQNYTQQDLHDNLVKICDVYNVHVIDVYKDSMLNTAFSQYVSPTPYTSDPSVTDLYHVDSDGLHPLALGYKEAYVPLVRKALGIGTIK